MSFWSWVRSKSMISSTCLRQAEHALGDDVLEYLGGAALDRVAAGAEQLVRPGVTRAQRAGAEQVSRQRGQLLVGLGPHPLHERSLWTRLTVLLDRGQAPIRREPQDLGLQVQIAELVGD